MDASTAISRPATRRTFEEVAQQVRALLSAGSLKPGDRLLPERELSQQLNVSRSALREALRTLEISGVIELRKGRKGGAFVTSGNPDVVSGNFRDLLTLGSITFEELAEARLWVGDRVVRIACQRATESDLQALEDNVRTAEALLAAGRFAEKTAASIEFHNILARATRNTILVMNIRTITEAMHGFSRRVDEPNDIGLERRHRIIDALRARNEARAAREMQLMMRRWHRWLLGRLAGSTQQRMNRESH